MSELQAGLRKEWGRNGEGMQKKPERDIRGENDADYLESMNRR
jgi:hypothetical protein